MSKTTLLLVCLTSLLASCGRTPPIVKTEFVDRPVPVQTPLDPRLTTSAPLPPAPLFKCRDKKARPTVCNEDMIQYLEATKKVAGDSILQIDAIFRLQPKQ